MVEVWPIRSERKKVWEREKLARVVVKQKCNRLFPRQKSPEKLEPRDYLPWELKAESAEDYQEPL